MSTILITGGTGLVGKALGQALLEKGYHVIILTRKLPAKNVNDKEASGLSYALWDVSEQTIDKDAVAKADHIIHLAGASVAEKRWTKKRKQEIVDSRVKSSELIVQSLRSIPNNIKTVVSASAIGWYGPDPQVPNPHPFTEEAPASNDFLGNTCHLWENSIEPVVSAGKRLVKLRIGLVISREGGAVKEFLRPMRSGIATILGNGKQVISWVHINDLVKMFIYAIEDEKMKGTYNAVAPQPVSNKEFMLALARATRKKFITIHVPTFILKLALGKMSMEVLKSATVSNEKIAATGFSFQFPQIKEALANL